MPSISRERCYARRRGKRRACIRACVVARAIAPVDAPKIRAKLQGIVLPYYDSLSTESWSNGMDLKPTL